MRLILKAAENYAVILVILIGDEKYYSCFEFQQIKFNR
ncbi:hypothetical protein BAR153v2_010570 [Bartonella sp. AR 15-3]|nr:hypothetical protein BAR153v2_010570 [Bartonella sp. AR 15-3]